MIYHVETTVDEANLQQIVDYLNGSFVGTKVVRYDEQDNPHETHFRGAAVILGGIRFDTDPEDSVE